MPSDQTRAQIDSVTIDPKKPLIVCDVDEVVVHFIRGFENYLATKSLWLDAASFALNGNIKNLSDNVSVAAPIIGQLLEEFFETRTSTLEAINGSAETINVLSGNAQVVFLSNLPHFAFDARRENLDGHGLSFPLISNEGPKGPAVERMIKQHQDLVFFIDDIPKYLSSVHEHCPNVNLIHFTQDKRFAKFLEPLPHEHFRSDNWIEVGSFISSQLKT